MKFDRNLNDQIVTYYEYFLMRHNWTMRGIPFGVGDWYLLVGLGSSAVEYPLEFAAIYVDQQDDDDPKYIYVEVTEDTIMKLIVAKSVSDLLPDLPERAIEAVNAASGGSTHLDR
jgi:hypothetical protein